METEYRYIGVGRHYFCVDQSLILLAWTLLVNHRRLQLAAMDLRASEVIAAIIKISRYRLHPSRRTRKFNFRRAAVIKTFSAGLAPGEAESEPPPWREAR